MANVVELEPISVLQDAMSAVNGARQMDYGHPLDNHTRTADLWSTYLGVPITAEQVCFLNILQKVSRAMNAVTRDGLVDIAGYAQNVQMIRDERQRRRVA